MAGINIPFTSDTAPFLRGTKDIEGALDDVADALDDLDREAQDTGDSAGRELSGGIEDGLDDATRAAEDAGRDIARELEDGLDDVGKAAKDAGDEIGDELDKGAKDAEEAADRLERKFTDALNDVRGSAKTAGDDLGREVKRGTDEASEGFDELKDEAGGSGREAAASFSGGFDDVTDLIQETAANAFAGFGPAGAVAGIAAAVGIGFLTAEFEKAKERAQETAESTAEITQEMFDMGSSRRGPEQVAEALREAATTAEDGQSVWSRWRDLAAEAGVELEDFALAMAGDTEAAIRVQTQLNDKWVEATGALDEQVDAAGRAGQAWSTGATLANENVVAVQGARDALIEQGVAVDEAGLAFAEAQGLIDDHTQAQIDNQEAARELAEAVGEYLGSAGEDWEEYVTDGVLNLDEYNANIEAHGLAVQNFQRNIIAASSILSDEALDYIRDMGPEAAPLLQAFIDAPLDQQERTAANWDRLGRAASDGFEGSLDITGPVGREIGAAQGYADRNPVRVGLTLGAHSLAAQVGYAAARIRPAAIQVPVMVKGVR